MFSFQCLVQQSYLGGGGVVVVAGGGGGGGGSGDKGGEERRPNSHVDEGSKKRKIKFKKKWLLHKYIHTLISVNCPCICSTV